MAAVAQFSVARRAMLAHGKTPIRFRGLIAGGLRYRSAASGFGEGAGPDLAELHGALSGTLRKRGRRGERPPGRTGTVSRSSRTLKWNLLVRCLELYPSRLGDAPGGV